MTISHPIALCFYGVGIVTSPPIWYLMMTKQFLHTNFRTFIFIITLGGLSVCVLTYVKFLCEASGYKNKLFYDDLDSTSRHFGVLYYIGNLLLCIERAVAVVKVSKYERYVSPAITASIILCALSTSSVVGAVLNALVKLKGHPPLLGFVVFYSALCLLVGKKTPFGSVNMLISEVASILNGFIGGSEFPHQIAILLFVYRKTSKKKALSYSLQKKYQDKENHRTAAVYTCISLNELLSGLASVSFHALVEANKVNDEYTKTMCHQCIDLIESYRILFINITILLNCFLWSRHQRKIFIEKYTNRGEQYFLQLQSSWNTARENSAGEKARS